MVGEIVGAIGSIANMLSSNKETARENRAIEDMKRRNKIAQSIYSGEGIMAELSNQGLTGYEGMKSEIQGELPTTLNQFKDSVAAGSLVDMLGNFQARQSQQLRGLSIQNEQKKRENKKNYASYLGTVVGGAETAKYAQDMELSLTQLGLDRQGKADQMKYLSEGLGMLGKLGDKDNSDWISGLFGKNNSFDSIKTAKPTTPQDTSSEGWF